MTFDKAGREAAGGKAARIVATAALALALGGCAAALSGSKAIPTFDLSAPTDFTVPRSGTAQLVVAPPTTLQVLDTQQIVVEPQPGQINYLNNAQWADRLPPLFQARLIQSFENASRGRSVGRSGEGIAAQYTLLTDIRSFGLQAFNGNEAVVDVSAKIVREADGRIVAAQNFKTRAAAAGTGGMEVTRALDEASDEALIQIVRWASGRF